MKFDKLWNVVRFLGRFGRGMWGPEKKDKISSAKAAKLYSLLFMRRPLMSVLAHSLFSSSSRINTKMRGEKGNP